MNDDKKEFEIAVFGEVNEHMRNTEQKQIAISVAYLGVVGVVISVLPSERGAILTPSPLAFFVWALVATAGCTVLALQKWYRVWKEHYMETIRTTTVNKWQVDSSVCACWMNLPPNTVGPRPRPDNIHIYFTWLLNLFLFAYGSYKWMEWKDYSRNSILCVIVIMAAYSGFLKWAASLKVCSPNVQNA